MSGHRRRQEWARISRDRGRYSGPEHSGYPDPRRPQRGSRLVVIIGLAVWSLLAWIGYVSVDAITGWIAAFADVAAASAKSIAAIFGIGKEVGNVADAVKSSGLQEQTIALLRWIAKPAIVVVWAIGALVLIAAPSILSRIRWMLDARRY